MLSRRTWRDECGSSSSGVGVVFLVWVYLVWDSLSPLNLLRGEWTDGQTRGRAGLFLWLHPFFKYSPASTTVVRHVFSSVSGLVVCLYP